MKVPSLTPPGPKTGFSNPKCFARSTNDCSEQISREHYVSRSVLDLMKSPAVSGVPWLPPGAIGQFGIDALTAKILCRRHNEALSPLDAYARRFIKTWTDAVDHASRPSLSQRTEYYLISGEMFERWCLKVFIGLYAAKIAAFDRAAASQRFTIDLEHLVEALFGRGLQPLKGLYLDPQVGERTTNAITFSPVQIGEREYLHGMAFDLHGFQWLLVTDERGNEEFLRDRQGLYRLQLADLNGPKRTSRIYMTWPQGVRQRLTLSYDLDEAVSVSDSG